jgi:hypothetical protein
LRRGIEAIGDASASPHLSKFPKWHDSSGIEQKGSNNCSARLKFEGHPSQTSDGRPTKTEHPNGGFYAKAAQQNASCAERHCYPQDSGQVHTAF